MLWYDRHMANRRSAKGKFLPGQHASPETEFKPGQHWRPRRPYWDRAWLYEEYVTKQRSAFDIASQFGITENAILFWLKKHVIPTRSIKETRAVKHWGATGEQNGMYGIRGEDHPNWQGGITPGRQALYGLAEWAATSKDVWERDGGRCQRCGAERMGHYMHIHHTIPFKEADLGQRVELAYLVLLCSKCHGWVHSKKNVSGEYLEKGGQEGG